MINIECSDKTVAVDPTGCMMLETLPPMADGDEPFPLSFPSATVLALFGDWATAPLTALPLAEFVGFSAAIARFHREIISTVCLTASWPPADVFEGLTFTQLLPIYRELDLYCIGLENAPLADEYAAFVFMNHFKTAKPGTLADLRARFKDRCMFCSGKATLVRAYWLPGTHWICCRDFGYLHADHWAVIEQSMTLLRSYEDANVMGGTPYSAAGAFLNVSTELAKALVEKQPYSKKCLTRNLEVVSAILRSTPQAQLATDPMTRLHRDRFEECREYICNMPRKATAKNVVDWSAALRNSNTISSLASKTPDGRRKLVLELWPEANLNHLELVRFVKNGAVPRKYSLNHQTMLTYHHWTKLCADGLVPPPLGKLSNQQVLAAAPGLIERMREMVPYVDMVAGVLDPVPSDLARYVLEGGAIDATLVQANELRKLAPVALWQRYRYQWVRGEYMIKEPVRERLDLFRDSDITLGALCNEYLSRLLFRDAIEKVRLYVAAMKRFPHLIPSGLYDWGFSSVLESNPTQIEVLDRATRELKAEGVVFDGYRILDKVMKGALTYEEGMLRIRRKHWLRHYTSHRIRVGDRQDDDVARSAVLDEFGGQYPEVFPWQL